MRISCTTVNFRRCSLDEALERIARAGYAYVEVEANLGWCGHVNPYQDDPIQFKEKVAGFGFQGVVAVSCARELITDVQGQGAKDIQQALVWAKGAGVPVVITGEGRKPAEMTEAEALVALRPRLERILGVAEACQVHLAMEPHGSISLAPGGLGRILGLVVSPWIGVNFDTGNAHRGTYVGTDRSGFEWKLEATRPGDELALLQPIATRVRHVHIKDVVGRRAQTLGHGEVNLRDCLELLKAAGYQGALTYQTEGEDTPEETQRMIQESRSYLTRALEEL